MVVVVFFWRGGGGGGRVVGGKRGVVFFGLKGCEKGMLLRKKQSFVNSVIEILLIINSNFTLLLK